MKRFFIFSIPLVCFFALCGCSDYKLKKEIGEKLSLDLSKAEIVEQWSNRGWFGDGNSLVVFALSEEAAGDLEALVKTAADNGKTDGFGVWCEMPLTGEVFNIFYGENGYDDSWFRNDQTGEKAIPNILDGYWWYSGDTANFDFAAFDASTELLYYYEFDS